MALPFFYNEDIVASSADVVLDEASSRHIVQVLRMQNGEQLQLTNGKGGLFTAEIADNNRKNCTVSIIQKSETLPTGRQVANLIPITIGTKITIGISLIKNSTRFEWFLEKAAEIGVSEIIPLICERTEKNTFKFERMKSILVSAMLQSRQCWLPLLHEPVHFKKLLEGSKPLQELDDFKKLLEGSKPLQELDDFKKLLEGSKPLQELDEYQQKFIAHCIDGAKRNLADMVNESLSSKIILIGPEGDFTPEEIEWALQNHFSAVTLGETRLRTETAGIVAATLLKLV